MELHRISDKTNGKKQTIGPELKGKVILLGEINSGKSSLVRRYAENRFLLNTQTTIGVAYFSKKETITGRSIKLHIWDTAGDERYRSLVRLYYRDAKVAIICYDITDRDSWEGVSYWVDELVMKEDCVIYLVATKIDLLCDPIIRRVQHKRVVTEAEIEHFIQSHQSADIRKMYVTSSKTGENVDTLFHDIAKDFVNKFDLIEDGIEVHKSYKLSGETPACAGRSWCCGRRSRREERSDTYKSEKI